MAEVTIRNSYKDLYSHAAKLVPDWFVKDANLKNLASLLGSNLMATERGMYHQPTQNTTKKTISRYLLKISLLSKIEEH